MSATSSASEGGRSNSSEVLPPPRTVGGGANADVKPPSSKSDGDARAAVVAPQSHSASSGHSAPSGQGRSERREKSASRSSRSSSSPPTPKVAVYILTPSQDSPSAILLQQRFEDKMFKHHIIKTDDSIAELPPSEQEWKLVRFALNDGSTNYPKSHVIVIKDSSITHATSEFIADCINHWIKASNWDICYLCKWLDRCDKYDEKENIEGHQSFFHRTYSPYGIQALIFSPETRDVLLGRRTMRTGSKFSITHNSLDKQLNFEIANHNFIAMSMTPNLFEFDPTLAKTPEDYKKSQQCRDPSSENADITPPDTFVRSNKSDKSSQSARDDVVARADKSGGSAKSSRDNKPGHIDTWDEPRRDHRGDGGDHDRDRCHRGRHDGKGDKDGENIGWWIALAIILLIIIIVVIACVCRRR